MAVRAASTSFAPIFGVQFYMQCLKLLRNTEYPLAIGSARRMMSKRADVVAKAWAGSILAAQEEQHTTVSTFNHPLFGAASYVRRGDARASVFAGIQNQQNPRLRLLPWEEHAKRGRWFFSWRGGFY